MGSTLGHTHTHRKMLWAAFAAQLPMASVGQEKGAWWGRGKGSCVIYKYETKCSTKHTQNNKISVAKIYNEAATTITTRAIPQASNIKIQLTTHTHTRTERESVREQNCSCIGVYCDGGGAKLSRVKT